MDRYIALLHRDATGGYGVSFPDFPGCISGGDDWAAATNAAAEALRLHVEGMLADGQKLPAPRSPEELKADPEFARDFRDAIVSSVPLLPPRGKPERINVMIDTNLLRTIDAAADRLGMSRSAFLSIGAQRLLESGIGGDLPARRSPGKKILVQPVRRPKPNHLSAVPSSKKRA